MVVLTPLLKGERTKRCKCGHVGLASPQDARSSFSQRPRRADGRREYFPQCKTCRKGMADPKCMWSGEKLPAAPYRAWLLHCQAKIEREIRRGDCLDASSLQRRVLGRLCDLVGLSSKRLGHYLHKAEFVDYAAVDRSAAAHGGYTPEQIYWEFGPRMKVYGYITTYWWEPQRQQQEERELKEQQEMIRCRTPQCRESAIEGGRFCEACAERLAQVRAELEGRCHAFRKTIGRKGTPTCCNPACKQPRLRGDRYCDQCQEEGWTEEDMP